MNKNSYLKYDKEKDEKMKILLVEDDEGIANFLKKGLAEESYTVDHTLNGEEALYLLQIHQYDLMILDVILPGYDGFEVCQILRNKNMDIPIIMLTAKDTILDKITGLDYGADDYMSKPFSFEELLARIKVKLRRKYSTGNIIEIEDLQIDINQKKVSRANQLISLTSKEYALLEFLSRNKNKILSETLISENLNDMNTSNMSNIINVYIYRLRTKIDKNFNSKLIHTLRGRGYLLGTNPHV
ncbi:MAG: DNA-binding response regulator [uncultured Sulfurovum sp.]|uniref:DNA-binding response regulator n=1 Tax=uncultured Sulfurovum sp. TaxID=269237 RepID=A0A6S6RWV5_9BACT|nr:MAG: DNA-binding response regulator [uncultured Sulfurovum sp.]